MWKKPNDVYTRTIGRYLEHLELEYDYVLHFSQHIEKERNTNTDKDNSPYFLVQAPTSSKRPSPMARIKGQMTMQYLTI